MQTRWQEIPGYEGLYKVSDGGKVIALAKKKGFLTVPEKEIKLKKNRHGYLLARLYKDNKRRDWFVHRLVGVCFIANPKNFKQVNHKFGNKEDNRYTELEWSSGSGNILHAFRTGLKKPSTAKGTASPKAKLTDEQVRDIRKSTLSSRKTAKLYAINHSIVDGIRKGTRWAHVV